MRQLILLWLLLGMLTACDTAATPVPTLTAAPSPTAVPPIGVDFATRVPPTAVVRQVTPTPLPSPTVTPSPTPILFVVESGDTLLGIAIDHGTTTEEIVALNPGLDPRFLLVGQEIVLPPPEIVVGETGGVLAADPAVVSVVSLSRYDTPQGTSWLMGEVINEGDTAAENVRVSLARLADPTGEVLDTAVVWTASTLLAPGEMAPFATLLGAPPAPAGAWQAVVTEVAGSARVVSPTVPSLVAEQVQIENSEPPQVTAELVNEGAQAVDTAVLTLTLYGAQGQVVGYTQRPLPRPLAPSERLTLAVPIAPPGGPATAVQLKIDN